MMTGDGHDAIRDAVRNPVCSDECQHVQRVYRRNLALLQQHQRGAAGAVERERARPKKVNLNLKLVEEAPSKRLCL
jgi:hypothetical protein